MITYIKDVRSAYMSSKDKTQSHHQYKQRKKRLEIKKEYDDKLEKILMK